jgi:phage recombination protein Bet
MSNSSQATNVATLPAQGSNKKVSLVAKFSEKFSIDPKRLMDILKSTAFKQRNGNPPTDEQMAALLVVADQYGLNPFTKEIYAFPDQQSGIVPVVGIDGWSRIINNHPQFDGMEFRVSEATIELKGLDNPIYEWIECIMYRKDRQRPTVIREYLSEIYREPFEKRGSKGPYVIKGPWQTHPRRFSRHKVVIQTARMALGYTGIYDEDEADRILEGQTGQSRTAQVQPSINFDANEPAAIEAPQEQSEILQDLAQAEFGGMEEADYESVPVQPEQYEESVNQEPVADEPPQNAVYQTEFGEVSARDMNMIQQMVQFTADTGSWKNTLDSFRERYAHSESTLAYAENELMKAQQVSK